MFHILNGICMCELFMHGLHCHSEEVVLSLQTAESMSHIKSRSGFMERSGCQGCCCLCGSRHVSHFR